MRADAHAVLVVDDDQQLTRTIADILRLQGYVSLTAGSGHEGLERIREATTPIPVALVDLNLPDMNGLDLVTRLQERPTRTEVVILTGHATLETAVAALRGKSSDYLVKPVAPRQLLDTVARGIKVWNHHRAQEALREDRARFQFLIESLSDIVAVLGADGTIEYMSPPTRRILGLDPAALTGDPFLRRVAEPDRAGVQRLLEDARRGAAPDAAMEFHLMHADGTVRRVEAVAQPLREERTAGSLVLTCRDITERRRLEERLLQSQKLDSIGRLAGGVAHDFNNQLTAIMNSAELANWVPGLPPQAAEELTEIRRAAERAANLTRQLLIFSRKDVTDPRPVTLNAVVRDTSRMLRRLIPTDVELVLTLGDDAPVVVADRTQLEQVIVNLVVNARDALPGGGRVDLRTGVQRVEPPAEATGLGPGLYALLEVTDDGLGMPRDVQDRIFEPFFTTKDEGRGTGLGLATCYGIVRGAGGAILVDSTPDAGSTFTVLLPAYEGPLEEGRAEPYVAISESAAADRRTVLVVDDDDGVRRVVAKILARKGYEVLQAPSGPDAIRLARGHEGPIHLLLSDLIMPQMKGPEVARRLQEARPELRVLFMSGYADTEVLELLKPYSPADLMEKPASADLLLARVARALRVAATGA